ncbi:hypothetical protein V3F56_07395 [Moorellaceae bacterium AZ2]
MDGRGRQLRQEVEFAGKPAGALSQALVWPAREAFASESQAGLGSKLGIRQAILPLTSPLPAVV